jgi:hypothetical protein
MTNQTPAWDQIGITAPLKPELRRCNLALTRRAARSIECARGDLNRARPTLVMPELASLSVK